MKFAVEFGGNRRISWKQLPVDDSVELPTNTEHCLQTMSVELWLHRWWPRFLTGELVAPPCVIYVKNPLFATSNHDVETERNSNWKSKCVCRQSLHVKLVNCQIMRHPRAISRHPSEVVQLSSYCVTIVLKFLCQLTGVTSRILFSQLQKALVIHSNRSVRSLTALAAQLRVAVVEHAEPNIFRVVGDGRRAHLVSSRAIPTPINLYCVLYGRFRTIFKNLAGRSD